MRHMRKPIRERSEAEGDGTYRFVAPISELAEGQKTSTVELLRTGVVRDRGLRITEGMLDSYVSNFNEGVYGQKIRITVGHKTGNGGDDPAAGWIEKVEKRKNQDGSTSLMGEIAWTELGEENISKKLFLYVSSEIAHQMKHPDTGKPVSNVLTGAALTNTPAIKRQQPIMLTEEEEAKIIHKTTMLKKIIEGLMAREKLAADDVKMVQSLLTEADSTELDELKPKVAELEAKLKKQVELAAADDAEEEEEEGEEEGDGKKKKSKKTEQMAEGKKVQALTEQLSEVTKRLERKELTESVEESMILSEESGVTTGFNDEDQESVVSFMESLDKDQRKAFTELVSKVKSVDFTVRGGAGERVNLSGSTDEKIAELSEKLMESDKTLSVADAQRKAAKQLGIKFA